MIEAGQPQLLYTTEATATTTKTKTIAIKTLTSSLVLKQIMRANESDQCVPDIQGSPMTSDKSNQDQHQQQPHTQTSSDEILIEMDGDSPPTRPLRPWDSDDEEYDEDPIIHQRRGRERHRSPALSRAIRKSYRSEQKKDIAKMFAERFRNIASPDHLRVIQEDIAQTCEDKELRVFENQLDCMVLKPNIKRPKNANPVEAKGSNEPKQIACLGSAGQTQQQNHTTN